MVSGNFVVKLMISIPSPKYVGFSESLIWGVSAISKLAKVLAMILQHNAIFDEDGKHAWAH